jgi:opacity protein-like surface antigen
MVVAVFLSVPAAAPGTGRYSPGTGELAGMQAVQFSVGSHLSLSEFQGQMFSYQRFLTDNRAIRVAGGLFLDLDDKDVDVEFYSAGETGSAEPSTWSYRGTLKLQMLFYRGNGPLRFFWGAGPKVTYSDSHSESVYYSLYGDEVFFDYRTRDIDRWELGLQGFAGVEWFMNEMFSLHAEYSVGAMYKFEDTIEQHIYEDDPGSNRRIDTTTRSPEFTSGGVRVGLSARF